MKAMKVFLLFVLFVATGCGEKKATQTPGEPAAIGMIRAAEAIDKDLGDAEKRFFSKSREATSSGTRPAEGGRSPSEKAAWDALSAAHKDSARASKALDDLEGTPFEKQLVLAFHERQELRVRMRNLERDLEGGKAAQGSKEDLAQIRARLRELESEWRAMDEGEKWREQAKH